MHRRPKEYVTCKTCKKEYYAEVIKDDECLRCRLGGDDGGSINANWYTSPDHPSGQKI